MDNSYKHHCNEYLEKYLESHCIDKIVDLVVDESKWIEKTSPALESTQYNSRYWLKRIASLQNALDLVYLCYSDETLQLLNELKIDIIKKRLNQPNSLSANIGNEFVGILSQRIITTLTKRDIFTFKQLSSYTVDEIRNFRDIGSKSISDIRQALQSRGLDFRK